nr:MAG TPA: hypothetical protein [Caudoviricetes sp.]
MSGENSHKNKKALFLTNFIQLQILFSNKIFSPPY